MEEVKHVHEGHESHEHHGHHHDDQTKNEFSHSFKNPHV